MISVFRRERLLASAPLLLVFFLAFVAPARSFADLVTNPSSAAFGSVNVGSSRWITETLSNNGRYKLTITSVSSSNAVFQFKNCVLPVTLYGGQSKACSLVFAPTSAGSLSGYLTISIRTYSGYSRTAKIAVSGTGVNSAPVGTLSGAPTSLSFGTLQTGSSSTLKESIVNSGSGAATISQVAISGTGFSFSGINPPLTLSAGQSATFNVVFAPQSSTTVSGTLSISSNASNPAFSVPLSGAGTSPGQLTISPATTSFGNVVVGTQQTQTATLSASGGPVSVSSIGLNGSGFSVSGISLPLSLAAGQSVPYTLAFAPQITGSFTGTVTFVSSTSPSATQSVSGSGIAAPQHSVTLNWSPSNSSNVLGYYVYRGSQQGGPYTAVNSATDPGTNYVDSTVQGGQTYYYVVTAVDTSGLQSGYSNQVQAVVPFP